MLALFGSMPSFGDAEILDLCLDRSNPSTLRVHEVYKNVIVTFQLTEIMGLKLDDFSPQNVLGRLELRLIQPQPATFGVQWLDPPPSPQPYYELKLESVYGLGGFIQARQVSVGLTKMQPSRG